MPIEHEAKILNIDPAAVVKLIREQGGAEFGEQSMRRRVYDITPGDQSKWIRLRDNGTKTTLAVKQIMSDAIDGTHEYEVVVSDFDQTDALLGIMGFTAKSYQENKRETFNLEGAEVSIDTWPRIPPYMEIEAESEAEVVRVAALLGYGPEALTGENTIKVYARYGIDLTAIPDLRF
ncbi:CYTH domain-containing protein [Amycolatopsis sp. PS_44_ISF1]|uniref:class IV adenylate cyclase n=1 Tax=Amycolatopsis sp. PS_44_ISF1 TaxID=2974917 RepID=UPI0028DFCA69|nr:CYTH domain-containing protein [Amycolatopsis sp. PS_44_ISF1]MDT8910925.1 CYTH domain-containing protein [Amycolatopsis sp. PS_44_ISF1]